MASDALLDWLLAADPALRWQVERDLAGEPEAVWAATRARTASEGWGARLLALQDDDGRWARGAYFPGEGAPPAAVGDGAGQPWTATTWSLTALREWGVPAAALGDTAERLAVSARWEYDDLPYWGGEVDACINAMTLANGAWLGVDTTPLVDWFAAHRLADGGWNCDWIEGATVSSFHSTLNAVRGLLELQRITGADTRGLRRAGEEYLLQRRLLRRLSTGERHGWATVLATPFRWRYSALAALDHFRSASLADATPPDPRLQQAVESVRAHRPADGRWINGESPTGAVWFATDAPAGEPSRWLTLIAERVLSWWDARS